MVLDPRIVIVTGGGSEIGRDVCHAFVESGASLVIGDSNPVAAEAIAARLRTGGADVVGRGVDPTDPTSNELMVAEAQERFGRVDVMVSCMDFARVGNEDVDRTRAALAMGLYLSAHAAAPVMRGQRCGCIVNVVPRGKKWPNSRPLDVPSEPEVGGGGKMEWWHGSPAFGGSSPSRVQVDERERALRSRPDSARSCNALHAEVVWLTRWLAQRIAGDGVRVNCVTHRECAEGLSRLPDSTRRVADAVLYLASDEARNINGKALHLDADDCPWDIAA